MKLCKQHERRWSMLIRCSFPIRGEERRPFQSGLSIPYLKLEAGHYQAISEHTETSFISRTTLLPTKEQTRLLLPIS